MSTAISIGSASQQAAAMLSQHTMSAGEDKAAPQAVAKAEASQASAAANGAGDRVEISAEAWSKFRQENAQRVFEVAAEFEKTGDMAARLDGLRQLAKERAEFKAIHGEAPKAEWQLKREEDDRARETIYRQTSVLRQQMDALIDQEFRNSEKIPAYALIKDGQGREVGRIRQDGALILQNQALGLAGGSSAAERIGQLTAGLSNPAEARFQALLTNLGGNATIERTGVEFKPYQPLYQDRIRQLQAQIAALAESLP